MTDTLYPAIAPYDSGKITVSESQQIYWEVSGNPNGKPALFLHGGPGGTLGKGGYRQRFDPQRYLIVGIDQRGCGRSLPIATDDLTSLATNTTQYLISDIEAVRQHLGIERWLVAGVSWGTTLALAYAQMYPHNVTELVLAAVTSTSREYVDWITEEVGCLFPEAWQAFEQSSKRRQGERVVEAYVQRLATPDRKDQLEAAQAWYEWESIHISLDPHYEYPTDNIDTERNLVFATLVTHYWAHDGFLTHGMEIESQLEKIGHIPTVLIHGRYDVSSPAIIPWRLSQKLPKSRLIMVESEGHGGPIMMLEMKRALDGFCYYQNIRKG